MDRHILNMNRKGFSLVELSIVMGAIAILTTAIVPMMIRTIEFKAGEKTVAEVALIQSAAQRFYKQHNQWPGKPQDLQQEGYLSQLWSLENPWGNVYEIVTDPNTPQLRYVSTNSMPENLTRMVKSRMPGSHIDQLTVKIPIGLSNDAVPAGVIVAWSGTLADKPEGWAICDGTQGTPDLRDKFIVGARQDDLDLATNKMAAKSSVMGVLLQSGGLASHVHGDNPIVINGIQYGHTEPHRLTIEEMPQHHHGYLATPWTGARYDGHSSPLMTQQSEGQTDDTGGDQPHTHDIKAAFNVPPFYALAFIMKLP